MAGPFNMEFPGEGQVFWNFRSRARLTQTLVIYDSNGEEVVNTAITDGNLATESSGVFSVEEAGLYKLELPACVDAETERGSIVTGTTVVTRFFVFAGEDTPGRHDFTDSLVNVVWVRPGR